MGDKSDRDKQNEEIKRTGQRTPPPKSDRIKREAEEHDKEQGK